MYICNLCFWLSWENQLIEKAASYKINDLEEVSIGIKQGAKSLEAKMSFFQTTTRKSNIVKSCFYSMISILLFIMLFINCATVTPRVSKEEMKEVENELKVKELEYTYKNLVRINTIGHQLIRNLPKEDRGNHVLFTGLLVSEADDYVKALFNLDIDKGVVIIGVIGNSPAMRAGVSAGDVLLEVNGQRIRDIKDIQKALYERSVGDTLNIAHLKLQRGGQPLTKRLLLWYEPLSVNFQVANSQEINAGAIPGLIVVTTGLLNFVNSDEELAAILSHEIAHLARRHSEKMKKKNLIPSLLIALASGAATGLIIGPMPVGVVSPFDVAGDIINAALRSKFSRDLERKADYYGILYMCRSGFDPESAIDIYERFGIEVPESRMRSFLSTHPPIQERIAYIRRILDEHGEEHIDCRTNSRLIILLKSGQRIEGQALYMDTIDWKEAKHIEVQTIDGKVLVLTGEDIKQVIDLWKKQDSKNIKNLGSEAGN